MKSVPMITGLFSSFLVGSKLKLVTVENRDLVCKPSFAVVQSNQIGSENDKLSAPLISLLQDKVVTEESRKEIESLIEDLVSSKVRFDPLVCLNGPFFATVYQQGPSPLWEKLSFVQSNMKGQQYTLSTSGDAKVVNYSEIFGKVIYLYAFGDFKKSSSTLESESEILSNESKERKDNIVDSILSIFQGVPNREGSDNEDDSLLQCPVDYTVSVTGGSVNILDFALQLPINGEGYLRVLYADEFCRIFTSPKDTTNTKWESEGLRIVQIRSDLIDSSFVLP